MWLQNVSSIDIATLAIISNEIYDPQRGMLLERKEL